MADALIGYSGYVGSTLLRQRQFDGLYRSTNIGDVKGKRFATVVCAGAPAQKWLANRNPEADEASIGTLRDAIDAIECARFILVSTVDVFADADGVDEDSPTPVEGLHAYGRHRLLLEQFVASRFPTHLIVRLAGLVGPGLRKNVIYDFHHGNNLAAINSAAVYQFYPMVNLWADLQAALTEDLTLVHLTAEPTSVADIARDGFGMEFDQRLPGEAPRYDMRSRHARLFGGAGAYQYTRREVIGAVRAYTQSEPKRS